MPPLAALSDGTEPRDDGGSDPVDQRELVVLAQRARITRRHATRRQRGVGRVPGRDVARGVPSEITLTQAQVAEAVAEPVSRIVHVVRSALEHTQPEIAADVLDEGITMTGGGSLLRDIAGVIADETGLPVRVSDDPLSCVALGAGMTLEDASYRGALVSV